MPCSPRTSRRWLSLAVAAPGEAYQVGNKNCFYKLIELGQLEMPFLSTRQLSLGNSAKAGIAGCI